MDFELMINSFPKLLNAAVITLKLLSVSLIIGLFIGLLFAILRLNKNIIINKFLKTKIIKIIIMILVPITSKIIILSISSGII